MTERKRNPLLGCGVEPRAEQGGRIEGDTGPKVARQAAAAQARNVSMVALAYRDAQAFKLDAAKVARATGLQLPKVTAADALAACLTAATGLLLGAPGVDDARARLALLALLGQCWRGDLALAAAVHRATPDPAPWWCWTLPNGRDGGPRVNRAWLAQRAACSVPTLDRARAALQRAELLWWPRGGDGHAFGLSYAVNVGRLLALADDQAGDREGERAAVRPSRRRAEQGPELPELTPDPEPAELPELAADTGPEQAGGYVTHDTGGASPMTHLNTWQGASPMIQGGASPMIQGGASPMTHHKYGETSAGPHKQGSAALPGAAPASRSVAPSAPSPAMDRSEPGERSAGLRSSQPGAGGRDGSTPRDPHASACPPDHPLAVLLADADADAQTRPALRALWRHLADLPPSSPPPRRTVDALAAELADARRAGAAPTLAAVVAAVAHACAAHACSQAAPRSIGGARRLAAESLVLDADATADRLAVGALAALAPPALDPLPLLAAGGAR